MKNLDNLQLQELTHEEKVNTSGGCCILIGALCVVGGIVGAIVACKIIKAIKNKKGNCGNGGNGGDGGIDKW